MTTGKLDMNKKTLVISGILLIIISITVIFVFGRTYTVSGDMPSGTDPDKVEITIDEEDIIKVKARYAEGDTFRADIEGIREGSAGMEIIYSDERADFRYFYVHRFGIITEGGYLGKMRGGIVIPLAIILYLLMILMYCVSKYRKDLRYSLYQYKNIGDLGLIVFIAVTIVLLIPGILNYTGIESAVSMALSGAARFTFIIFPAAVVMSILVTLSNINLMRKEGYNWRNMLGCILGILLLASTITPWALGEYLQRSTVIDVHNQNGSAYYVELIVENSISAVLAYLECILIGTIAVGVKAARHIPEFNKDYILILGCQIRKDGTLTPLLKGRTDRALEFAEMQKKETGKDIVFVPSGGKGNDEVMSEGDAITEYLKGIGIPEEKILTERESKNTYENFRNSIELIREREGSSPEIAFSTTNYHVLRSGQIALSHGIRAEGIGSRTKSYFWINAFIREFIATLYTEKKKHIAVIVILLLAILAMVGVLYIAINN